MTYIKNYKILFAAIALTVLLGTVSCKKSFLDVNTDPNRITEANVEPELLFNGAAANSAARNASGNFTFLHNWLGYFSRSGDFAIDQTETSYNIDFLFSNPIWVNHYGQLFNLDLCKNKALAKGDTVMAGAAMVLSAKLWQELVDVYGNIPYTQAFHYDQFPNPTYDKDSTVYRLLQGQLDQAIIYLQAAAKPNFVSYVGLVNFGVSSPTASAPASNGSTESVAGKINHFIRFANTIKLRLLLHASEVNPSPTAELAKITANGGVLHAGESVTINPGFTNSTGKQSFFYANYGYTAEASPKDGNNVARANVYTVSLLGGASDPRLFRLYRNPGAGPTTPTTTVTGTTYGLASGNPLGTGSSKMGFGTANNSAQDAWIFTSVESAFLEAEAVQRGWLTYSGGAAAAYTAAVTESFVWLGVPSATTAATTYLATPIANYASASDKLRLIATQKYIAMNSINALEAWTDYRKYYHINKNYVIPTDGYLSVNPLKRANRLPNRLLYPQSEYIANSVNVLAQGTISVDNIFSTSKIFWQL